MTLPHLFKKDFQTLFDALAPLTKRAYFVGGAVRDFLMGRPLKDVDIEVYDIPPEQFCNLMERLGAKGVGKSFFVYKLGLLDVSLPRSERKVAPGHAGFDVSWCNDPLLASARRDFTINALMINLFSGELLDFHGGRADMDAKLLRHIDDRAFGEDSLRVLRAMQFAARFSFRIAPKTVTLCRQIPLDDLPRERIWGEFEKLLGADDPLKGVYFMIALRIAHRLWGIDRAPLGFFRAVRRLPPPCLLYALRSRLHLGLRRLCGPIGAPKRIERELARWPLPPKRVSDRFLAAVALKGPLSQWPGLYELGLAGRADALGLLKAPLDPGVNAADLLGEGYVQGPALGRELRRRILNKVRNYGKTVPSAD